MCGAQGHPVGAEGRGDGGEGLGVADSTPSVALHMSLESVSSVRPPGTPSRHPAHVAAPKARAE